MTRGGPAELNGRIRPGDVLLAVDRRPTGGVPTARLLRCLCGPPGTPVELRLARGPPQGPEGGGGGGEWTAVLRREAMVYAEAGADAGWPGTLEAV